MNNLLLSIPKPIRLLRIKLFLGVKLSKFFLLSVCLIFVLLAVYIFQINEFMLEKQRLELWQISIKEISEFNKELEFRLANSVHVEDELSKIKQLGLEKADKFNYLQPTEQSVARRQP